MRDVLPVSDETSCNAVVLVQGIEMGLSRIPLHLVQLKSELVSGTARVGLCDHLPIEGVDMIMENDLAGGKVTPLLEVLNSS